MQCTRTKVSVHEAEGLEVGVMDGDNEEGAGRGTSRHAEQHGYPGLHLESARSECRGHKADTGMYTVTKPNPGR